VKGNVASVAILPAVYWQYLMPSSCKDPDIGGAVAKRLVLSDEIDAVGDIDEGSTSLNMNCGLNIWLLYDHASWGDYINDI